MDYEKAIKEFKWETNPFTFNILPELFIGYDKEVNEVVGGLKSGNKFSLLLGPTGSGKTTFLKSLVNRFNGYDYVLYLSKPPKKPEDWLTVFREIIKPRFSIFSRGNGPSLYNLSEVINRKLKDKKCLLFVDECHEASLDSLEWLRTITDQTENLFIALAGLPVFEKILKSNLETFMRRVETRIELSNLTKAETRELIKKRIENEGGEDIKPFTANAVEYIYERTGGFPREILRICNDLVQKALRKNITIIDLDFLKESETTETRISLETINELPERQRIVLETLSKKGELTPSELISNLKLDGYKDRENAVRSVNNLLRRLMSEGLADRTRRGKTYKYKVSGKYQNLMVEA
jgi:type II secretory pathway predicted ATPase ExeA